MWLIRGTGGRGLWRLGMCCVWLCVYTGCQLVALTGLPAWSLAWCVPWTLAVDNNSREQQGSATVDNNSGQQQWTRAVKCQEPSGPKLDHHTSAGTIPQLECWRQVLDGARCTTGVKEKTQQGGQLPKAHKCPLYMCIKCVLSMCVTLHAMCS